MQEKLQKHSVVVKERDSAVARDGFARTGIIKGAETISEAACGGVQKRDVRLKLARKGFHETTQAVKSGIKKSTKRVYQYAFGDDGVSFVHLRGCA